MVGSCAAGGADTGEPGSVVVDAATRRLGLYFALGGLMVVLDTTLTIVAMPGLIGDFDSTLATIRWATTGYVLGLVAAMPLSVWATETFRIPSDVPHRDHRLHCGVLTDRLRMECRVADQLPGTAGCRRGVDQPRGDVHRAVRGPPRTPVAR